MESGSTTARYTSLLDNAVLARAERMRLNPLRRLTNRSRGEHPSGKGGNSTEFVDYRDYSPGDDLRYVDWNIYSRLEKPYLKIYRLEEELHVVVLIDRSSSMQFEEKFVRARELAAVFGLMGLMGFERVSVYASPQAREESRSLTGCSGRKDRKTLFQFLESLTCGGNSPIESAIDSVLKLHSGRGVAIILSDFLTWGDLHKPLSRLASAGLELFGLQILGPSEIHPELAGDVQLVDSESGQTLDISSAGDLLGMYQEHRLSLERELSELCRQRNGRFLSISSAESVESILFDRLRRKGWVR